ncbi:uncharacterized protein LOC141910346 [Tubulanus polymorphus]|uniref:uncharacterized protein LOC141910346 n=1 Tax=Tubulanus polymorphus TaxID=672921 RepID=UPI003DA59067
MVNVSGYMDCPPVRLKYVFVHNLYVYGIGAICVFGIVGNVLSLFAFGLERQAVVSIRILKVLACCDMSFLAVCLVYFFVRHVRYRIRFGNLVFRYKDNDIDAKLAYSTVVLYFITQQIRNWITAYISVNRFLNIRFPLWSRRVLTWKCCKINVVSTCLISIVCHVPRYWLSGLEYKSVHRCSFDLVAPYIVKPKPASYARFDMIVYFGFLVGFPMVVLYATNLGLLNSIHIARSRRSVVLAAVSSPKSSRSDRQADKMVMAILLIFTICETPACVDRVASAAGFAFKSDDFKQYARKAGLFLVVLDSALNFVVYLSINLKFRQNLKRLFR